MMTELTKLLEELSKSRISSKDELKDYVKRFIVIYSKDFRHQYSLILKTVLKVSQQNEDDRIAPIEILQENMELIKSIFDEFSDAEVPQRKNFLK